MYRANRGYPGAGGFLGHESIEDRNQELEGELKGKISALKSLSIDIGMEVREQNR
jgi:blocked early in transport 1